MRIKIIGPIPILFILPCLSAQDFDHFEVASIRPAGVALAPARLKGGPGTSDPGQINYDGIPVFSLILKAFDLQAFQLSMPSAGAAQSYTIVAKVPASATRQQFNVMLQNLLTDRFGLRFHKESRETPVYVLTAGPNGAKLKESDNLDDPPSIPKGAVIGAPNAEGFPVLPPGFIGVVGRPSNGHMRLAGQRAPLSKLTPWLGQSLDRPIIDQTGLTGEYDFKLDFEWLTKGPDSQTAEPPEPVPSVFDVVQRELGLRLEPKKLPLDYIVIDHLTAPTAN